MKPTENRAIFEYVQAVEAYYEAVPRIGDCPDDDCPEGDSGEDVSGPEKAAALPTMQLPKTAEWHTLMQWLDTQVAPSMRRTLAAGEVLYRAEEPADTLWLVRRGAVLVQRPDASRGAATLDIVGAGRCVGWLALRPGACQEFQAQAVGESEVLGFSHADIARAVAQWPELGLRLAGLLALRLEQAQHWAASLGAYPAAERVAHLLTRLACEFGRAAEAGAAVQGRSTAQGRNTTQGSDADPSQPSAAYTEIELRLNQEDLSRMVGTTRETVSHSLHKLRDSGAVLRARSPYVVDVAALRRYSEQG